MPVSWPKLIRGITVRHVRIFSRCFDGRDCAVGIDPTNGGLATMDPIHMNTHAGLVYEVQHSGIDIAADASIEVLLRVNERYPVHGRVSFKSGGPSLFSVFEQPTVTAPGTALNVINRNRRVFAPAARSVVNHTPTTTADGLLLSDSPEYSDTGPPVKSAAGGESEGFNEWVFREGWDYLLRLKNTHSSTAFPLWMSLIFYEQELRL